jgi:hypothetical protein
MIHCRLRDLLEIDNVHLRSQYTHFFYNRNYDYYILFFPLSLNFSDFCSLKIVGKDGNLITSEQSECFASLSIEGTKYVVLKVFF